MLAISASPTPSCWRSSMLAIAIVFSFSRLARPLRPLANPRVCRFFFLLLFRYRSSRSFRLFRSLAMAEDPSPNSSAGGEQAVPKPPFKDPKKKKDEKKEEDLSEEDLALKQQLELYVERVQDADSGVQKFALESMRKEIRTATSSMTSVPKPLKFLRPHYGTLKAYFEMMPESDLKA